MTTTTWTRKTTTMCSDRSSKERWSRSITGNLPTTTAVGRDKDSDGGACLGRLLAVLWVGWRRVLSKTEHLQSEHDRLGPFPRLSHRWTGIIAGIRVCGPRSTYNRQLAQKTLWWVVRKGYLWACKPLTMDVAHAVMKVLEYLHWPFVRMFWLAQGI